MIPAQQVHKKIFNDNAGVPIYYLLTLSYIWVLFSQATSLIWNSNDFINRLQQLNFITNSS